MKNEWDFSGTEILRKCGIFWGWMGGNLSGTVSHVIKKMSVDYKLRIHGISVYTLHNPERTQKKHSNYGQYKIHEY